VAEGCRARPSTRAVRGQGLCGAREWDAALSSGGQSLVERGAPRDALHATGRLPCPTCRIVWPAPIESHVLDQMPKAIVPAA
jgi:hypothetical protein